MKKVLIVDDDVTFQLTMSTKLKEAGYEVISALDGEVGLEKACNEHPDVILLDIKMPKLDGLQFLHKLRDHRKEDEKLTPIYITSNLSTMDNISEGVSLGIKGYIVKSDESLDTILSTVEATLGK